MTRFSYELEWDYYHSGDPGKDCFAWDNAAMQDIRMYFSTTRDVKIPLVAYFTADFSLVPKYDLPTNNVGLLIMSQQMINILMTVKPFRYRALPIIMLDDIYLNGYFDQNGNLKPEVRRNIDYVAVQLLDETDVFDYERSDYDESPLFPGKIGAIGKMFLKEPTEGFPSLFRIKGLTGSRRFISSEAKAALEDNGIQGCVFEPVEVSEYGS